MPWGITLLSSISSVQLRLSTDICFPSDTWACAFTPPLHYSILFLIVDVRAIGVIPIESRASGQVPFRRESPVVGNPLFRLKLFGQLKLLKMDMESFISPTTASDASSAASIATNWRSIRSSQCGRHAHGDHGEIFRCSKSLQFINSCRLPARTIQLTGHRVVCTHQKPLYMTRAFPDFLALSD